MQQRGAVHVLCTIFLIPNAVVIVLLPYLLNRLEGYTVHPTVRNYENHLNESFYHNSI